MTVAVNLEVFRVIVHSVVIVVSLIGFSVPLVLGDEVFEGKLCCDDLCSSKLIDDIIRYFFLIHAHTGANYIHRPWS